MDILGLITLFFVMIIQVVIPPLPAELIVIAAAYEYGLWITALVSGSGLFLGGVLVYGIGRWIEQRFEHLFARKNVAKVIERLRDIGIWLLLVRILPYNPSDIISYAAGVLRLDFKAYLLITFVVSYIRCFLLAYFGTKITDMQSLFVIFSLLIISAIIGGAVAYGWGKRDK